jgi:hypothetical protein
MTMLAFHALFPEEAENESRTVLPMNDDSLPSHSFLFAEAYCVEHGCDCRRVMLNVIDLETQSHVATINYAFEPPEPALEDEGQMFLDPLNPQSELSEAFLEHFRKMMVYDRGYHDRLVRHYEMWKRVVDDPTHSAQKTIRSARSGDGIVPAREPVRRSGPKIGPNEPCPCGSGRKYKKCCRP